MSKSRPWTSPDNEAARNPDPVNVGPERQQPLGGSAAEQPTSDPVAIAKAEEERAAIEAGAAAEADDADRRRAPDLYRLELHAIIDALVVIVASVSATSPAGNVIRIEALQARLAKLRESL